MKFRWFGLWSAALALLVAGDVVHLIKSSKRYREGQRNCQPDLFKIAIDIGHYRSNPGAISATGLTEYQFNLILAHRVTAMLKRAGYSDLLIIGESGETLENSTRVAIASNGQADLLISLHHDSVQPGYLRDWEVNGTVQRYSDRFHGFSLFISGKNVQFAASRVFATMLGEALISHGMSPSMHHAEKITGENRELLNPSLGLYKFDNLEVLKGVPIPATLLESGIIVNRSEEQAILQGAYHQYIATSVVEAVEKFCASNPRT